MTNSKTKNKTFKQQKALSGQKQKFPKKSANNTNNNKKNNVNNDPRTFASALKETSNPEFPINPSENYFDNYLKNVQSESKEPIHEMQITNVSTESNGPPIERYTKFEQPLLPILLSSTVKELFRNNKTLIQSISEYYSKIFAPYAELHDFVISLRHQNNLFQTQPKLNDDEIDAAINENNSSRADCDKNADERMFNYLFLLEQLDWKQKTIPFHSLMHLKVNKKYDNVQSRVQANRYNDFNGIQQLIFENNVKINELGNYSFL